jgi:hypothetical protein
MFTESDMIFGPGLLQHTPQPHYLIPPSATVITVMASRDAGPGNVTKTI